VKRGYADPQNTTQVAACRGWADRPCLVAQVFTNPLEGNTHPSVSLPALSPYSRFVFTFDWLTIW
jgi:hypothetical protein